jgi:hypothetical protein
MLLKKFKWDDSFDAFVGHVCACNSWQYFYQRIVMGNFGRLSPMQAATKLGSRLQVWYLLLQLFRYLKTSVTTEVTTLTLETWKRLVNYLGFNFYFGGMME